ncbi:MAG TPA: PPOX class F420-dependent oxidoreductase [Actinomycetales bacterium]|jgi:hypothetical protein
MRTDELDRLAQESFLSLTTFRRTGEGVSTPMWVARDGDLLVMTTVAASGKVKRLRNDARVELRPCDRRGTVAPGAVTTPAAAEVVTAAPDVERHTATLRAKYGFQFTAMLAAERIIARGRKRERVILRLS